MRTEIIEELEETELWVEHLPFAFINSGNINTESGKYHSTYKKGGEMWFIKLRGKKSVKFQNLLNIVR